jgi:hypothetical protein
MSLWTMQSRSFIAVPLLPISQGMVRFCSPFCYYLLVSCLLVRVFRPDIKWLRYLTLACIAALVCMDIHRLQVWVWFYLLWYLCFEQMRAQGFAMLAGFVYLWSGINKINLHFVHEVVPDWMQALGLDGNIAQYSMAALAIALEIGIGIALMCRRLSVGVVASTWALHLFILFVLALQQSWNQVIWPWNIALPLAVTVLYMQTRGTTLSSLNQTIRATTILPRIGLVSAGIMPVLFLVGWWPYPLAWAMYSGLQPELTLAIKGDLGNHTPATVKDASFSMDGETFVVLDDWTFRESNVPPFAADFVFTRHATDWCQQRFGALPYCYQLKATRFCKECEQFERKECPIQSEGGAEIEGVGGTE